MRILSGPMQSLAACVAILAATASCAQTSSEASIVEASPALAPTPIPAPASAPAAPPVETVPVVAEQIDPDLAWARFSGWKRYHANCATCHGPDGLGSTFAPDLVTSLNALDQGEFMTVVVNGKNTGDLTMPSFGINPNVMCYIGDIYVYLQARSGGDMERGRPKHFGKPEGFAEAETACMGV